MIPLKLGQENMVLNFALWPISMFICIDRSSVKDHVKNIIEKLYIHIY